MLHRRDLLGAFAAYALVAELSSVGAARRDRSVRAWLDRQDVLARDLASGPSTRKRGGTRSRRSAARRRWIG